MNKAPSTIVATGIKTGSINLSLSPLTVVIGDNGAGKTAIADSIRLALLGFHPVLGKRNSEIMKLSNGSHLEVSIPGTPWGVDEIIRSFSTKGKSTKCELSKGAVDYDEKTNFPPVILDFDSFLRAKGTERREILESVLPPVDAESIKVEIQAKVNESGLSETLDKEEDFGDFMKLTKAVAESGKEWKQEKTRIKGSVQELEIQIAEAVEPSSEYLPSESLEDLETRRSSLLQGKGAAESELREMTLRKSNAVTPPLSSRPSKEEIKVAEEALKHEKEVAAKNELIEANNKTRRETLEDLKSQLEAALSEAGDKVRTEPKQPRNLNLEELISTQKAERLKLISSLQEFEADEHVSKERLKSLEGNLKTIISCGACPTCGTKGEALANAARELFSGKIEKEKETLEGTRNSVISMKELIDKIDEEQKTASDIERSWLAWEAFNRAQALKTQIDDERLRKFDETEPDRVDEATECLDELKANLHEWEIYAAAPSIPTDQEIDTKAESIDAINHNLKATEDRIQAIKSYNQATLENSNRIAQLNTAKADLEAASKNIEELKKLGDWSKSRSLEETSKRLEPLLDPANSILTDVVDGSLSIQGTEVGLVTKGKFRPIEVLSGAEATAVAAAIQVALASNSDLSFVMVDELSKLRLNRKVALVANISAAIQNGLIHGALLLDHDERLASEVESFTDAKIHRLN